MSGAHPLEVIWTIVALAGAVFSVIGIRGILGDLKDLETRNGRRIIGIALLQTESIRLLIQSSWAALGFFLLVQENEIRLSFVTVMLISTNALLTLKTYITMRARQKLRSPATYGRRKDDLAGGQ